MRAETAARAARAARTASQRAAHKPPHNKGPPHACSLSHAASPVPCYTLHRHTQQSGNEDDASSSSSGSGMMDATGPGAGAAAAPPQAPPAPRDQAAEVAACEAAPLAEGDRVYLVASGWWGAWRRHTGYEAASGDGDGSGSGSGGSSGADGGAGAAAAGAGDAAADAPGPIDNGALLEGGAAAAAAAAAASATDNAAAAAAAAGDDDDAALYDDAAPGAGGAATSTPAARGAAAPALRPALEEGADFVLVREATWRRLARWHGGGPAIARTAVVEGRPPDCKRPRVNLRPARLEVVYRDARGSESTKWIEADMAVRVQRDRQGERVRTVQKGWRRATRSRFVKLAVYVSSAHDAPQPGP